LTRKQKNVAQPLKLLYFKEDCQVQSSHNHERAKSTLTSIIYSMEKTSMLYAKNPEKDFTRRRKLPFSAMLRQIVCMGGNTLTKELMDAYDYDPDCATSSAFVQQRDKILPQAFEYLLHAFTTSCANIKRYKGYRLLAGDGSSLNIARNPHDSETFYGMNRGAQGYNLLHLNALYDLCSKVYVDAFIQAGVGNEHKGLTTMVDRASITDKVIVTLDRGYESYNNMAHIEQKGWWYIIRVKDVASSGILSGLKLPSHGGFDVPVSFSITRKQTNAVKAQPHLYKRLEKSSTFDYCDLYDNIFYPISFRVVRVMLPNSQYESLVTNLPADEFNADELREIYSRRWGIETSFRELKHLIGMANFHSKKREFIAQEIFARLVMYNFVSIITVAVTIPTSDKKHEYRVNFSNAVIVCRRFLRLRNNEPPLDVEALLRKCLTPVRPTRDGHSGSRSSRYKALFSFNYRIS